MRTCEYAGPAFEPRSHPWVHSADEPDCRYYDLKAMPALIRTSLEDFVPWQGHAAVENFYRLLEELNAPTSPLESNDCAFTGPAANEHLEIEKSLQCSGRVMLLFRRLERNTTSGEIESLKDRLHLRLLGIDPGFLWGIVGTTIIPVCYLALPKAQSRQYGSQLMISFWAWGDSESENMLNLARLMTNLIEALAQV